MRGKIYQVANPALFQREIYPPHENFIGEETPSLMEFNKTTAKKLNFDNIGVDKN
jgi:hypothetical protein